MTRPIGNAELRAAISERLDTRLVEEVEHLRAELAAVRELHSKTEVLHESGVGHSLWCGECELEWPCDTARLLGVS